MDGCSKGVMSRCQRSAVRRFSERPAVKKRKGSRLQNIFWKYLKSDYWKEAFWCCYIFGSFASSVRPAVRLSGSKIIVGIVFQFVQVREVNFDRQPRWALVSLPLCLDPPYMLVTFPLSLNTKHLYRCVFSQNNHHAACLSLSSIRRLRWNGPQSIVSWYIPSPTKIQTPTCFLCFLNHCKELVVIVAEAAVIWVEL